MEFQGYERPDGSVGIRNHVVVIPGGRCANELATRIAVSVPGVVALVHNQPCVHLKPDIDMAKRVLIGLGSNSNTAAALVVGIGCESMPLEELVEGIARTKKPVELLTIGKEGSYHAVLEKGLKIARHMTAEVSSLKRHPFNLSHLNLGLKCGGSDATSALACNPTAGWAADAIIFEGGRAIFTETAEIIGAEHILARRAADDKVAQRLFDAVNRMDGRIKDAGVDIRGSEPTPGNIQGGLTTLEEKSLGAIAKSGTTTLKGVLEWGERPGGKGLFFMNGSANTPQVFLGLAAAGAQVLTFGFGGGLPARFRSLPALSGGGMPILPVIKILGNPMDVQEGDYFDIYVGSIIEGKEAIGDAGKRLLQEILVVASGKPTKQEMSSSPYQEVMEIYRTGPIL
jgi:altronate dehydratase large subunit